MTQDTVVSICVSAMQMAMKIGLPLLLVGLVLGLIVSVFQAVTQIQEQTLTFIPKIIGLAVILVVLGPWMLDQIVSWTAELYGGIPEMVGT